MQYRREVIEVGVIEYSAERHLKAVKSEGYDEGYETGYGTGYDDGIKGAVKIMRSLGMDDSAIVIKLCEQYGLSNEMAKKYL